MFNAAQVENAPAIAEESKPQDIIERVAKAEAIIAATGAKITYRGDWAFYRRDTDEIFIPDPSRFFGSKTSTPQEAFFSTILHEVTHWCGAPDRLDRKKGARFGDQAYAYEELVAEIGSAILCAEAGIANEPRADHAQYLAGWLRVLKADSRAIFSAASEASKAVDYVLSCGALVERAQAA